MWTRRLRTSNFVASVASGADAFSKRPQIPFLTTSFSSTGLHRRSFNNTQLKQAVPLNPQYIRDRKSSTQQTKSFFGGPGGTKRIDRPAMKEIIENVANSSREESGYVLIDVRGHEEVQSTGKLNDAVETLPLHELAEALAMDEEDFTEDFGFDKPALDETIVFSCRAGMRSYQASQLAQMAGYSNVLEYEGGSNEWFSAQCDEVASSMMFPSSVKNPPSDILEHGGGSNKCFSSECDEMNSSMFSPSVNNVS